MDGHVERPGPGRGLSARILALAVVFLLAGEILIFVPSVARYKLTYLEEIIATAHLATLATWERDQPIDAELEAELLRHVGAKSVTLWEPAARIMLGQVEPAAMIYDLRQRGPFGLIEDAFETLTSGPRTVRVIGTSPRDPAVTVDVTFDETALRRAMFGYASRVLALSLLLSLVVASLLFMSLRRMILMPLASITSNLAAFRRMPEDAGVQAPVSGRRDEIGIVEQEVARMQSDLREALRQKTRLAALGAAVGQISHDLKNILASAVLISDRLEESADPAVRALAPRLVGTLERAVRLCTVTLSFVRERAPEPRLHRFFLLPLLDEVATAVVADAPEITWHNDVDPKLEITADRDLFFRVLLNLGRNSREAFAGRPGHIICSASTREGIVELGFEDDGPGISADLVPVLFASFTRSTKPYGSGLGLAICREIMRAHGGDIELVQATADGTQFRLLLPQREFVVAAA